MPQVILTGHIIVAESDLSAIKNALTLHIQLTREEQGCLVFKVTQDESNAHQFHVHEEFVDRATFEAHQQRVASSSWEKISKNAERHYFIKEQE